MWRWEAGSNIEFISNNLRCHLVKKGETVKQKAVTTGCSLEDSGLKQKHYCEHEVQFWARSPGKSQILHPWVFLYAARQNCVTWSLYSLDILFKDMTR